MYETETYDAILERMLARVPDSIDKRPSSPIYDTHSAAAIELQILYIELETLIQNSYGDTAAREFLILLAADRGITPESATHAVLLGKFTPAGVELTGQRFNIGEINYIVTEHVSNDEEASYYQVQCETTGEVGNQYLGQMVPMEYIAGLETAELTKILIPGEDEEETEALRQRYLDSFNEQAFGGNQADYLAKVRAISGVGNCKIERVWNGDIRPADMIPSDTVATWYNSIISTLSEEVAIWLTTVYTAAFEKKLTVGGTVYISIVDSDDYGEASSILVQSVQNELDPQEGMGEGYGLAPIGHVVNVESAKPVMVRITTTVTFEEGYSWSNLKIPIENAVDAYLLELRKTWAESAQIIVRISQIENYILGVNGVIDVANTKINDDANNLILGQYEIPVLGGVST